MLCNTSANTVALYKLEDDAKDYSGNSRNLSNYNVSFTTLNGVKCAYFNGNSYLYRNDNPITGSSNYTVSSWFYKTSDTSVNQVVIAFGQGTSTQATAIYVQGNTSELRVGGWTNDRGTGFIIQNNNRYCVTLVHESGTIRVYVNGTIVYTDTVSFNLGNNKTRIGCSISINSPDGERFYGYLGDQVEENKSRTGDDATSFYNKTKSRYGL